MFDVEQIIHELKKQNATLERIERANKECSELLLRINDKLFSIVNDYLEREFYSDAEDDDNKKKITWTQLAMIIQSLKRIESSLSDNKD